VTCLSKPALFGLAKQRHGMLSGRAAMWNVLLVDTAEDTSSALAEHLEHNGYYVFSSRDGRGALDIVNSENIDVIVLRARPELADRRAMDGLGGFVWALALEHGIPLIVTTDRIRDVRRLQQWHVMAFAEQQEPTAVDVALRRATGRCRTRRLRPVQA
jgi:DNA-binding response OmpR family regulator